MGGEIFILKVIKKFLNELFQKYEILIEADEELVTSAKVTKTLTEYANKNNMSLSILEEGLMPVIKLNDKIYNVRLNNDILPIYYYLSNPYYNTLIYYNMDNKRLYLYPKNDDQYIIKEELNYSSFFIFTIYKIKLIMYNKYII